MKRIPNTTVNPDEKKSTINLHLSRLWSGQKKNPAEFSHRKNPRTAAAENHRLHKYGKKLQTGPLAHCGKGKIAPSGMHTAQWASLYLVGNLGLCCRGEGWFKKAGGPSRPASHMTMCVHGEASQSGQGRYQAVNTGLMTRFPAQTKDLKSHVQLLAVLKNEKRKFRPHFNLMRFFREQRFTLCVIKKIKNMKPDFYPDKTSFWLFWVHPTKCRE